MDSSLLKQLWPIFVEEAREHLQQISAGVLELEKGTAEDGLLKSVRRTAHGLKGSAASLGITHVEKLAHAIETALEGRTEKDGLEGSRAEAILAAIDGAEGALKLGDEGAEPTVANYDALLAALKSLPPAGAKPAAPAPAAPAAPAAPPPPAADDGFKKEAGEALKVLEGALRRLCTPLSEGERATVVSEAADHVARLEEGATRRGATAIAEAAGRIGVGLVKMIQPGVEASRAAAAAADDFVLILGALESLPAPAAPAATPAPAAAPAPAPVPAAPSPAAPPAPAKSEAAAPEKAAPAGGEADKVLRISIRALESLARQVEEFTLLRARKERRAREIASQAEQMREVRELCQQVLADIRNVASESTLQVLDDAVGRLRTHERALARGAREQAREAEQIRLASTVVREDLRDMRMVPASTVLEPLRRTVREVAGRLGKKVELSLVGNEVRLDRRILDELKVPLQHLLRNAIDHGLETPEVRRVAGKPEAGSLEVRVERCGPRVAVMVSDDGAGMSVERVRDSALRKGLLTPQSATQLNDEETLRLVFQPGFSTKSEVTEVSGRGVGLDAVQDAAHRLRGTVELSTEPGRGTSFTMDLPLTLAATLAVVVRAGLNYAALPFDAVEDVVRLSPEDLGTVAAKASARIKGAILPLASLPQVVGAEAGRLPFESNRSQPAVVLNAAGARVAFAVDEVVGQHEVVIQSLGKHLAKAAHLGGAAVLEDGRVIPVLNAAEIVRLAKPLGRESAERVERTRILIADDSLTTRAAMKAVLEIAGYHVIPASDGEEAFELLKRSRPQLVVSDVQMPRLDGFGLTRRIKSDPNLSSIPVIIVTSLEDPADRAMGLDAGADGYLVKREVERGKLLELVRQLLPMRPGAA